MVRLIQVANPMKKNIMMIITYLSKNEKLPYKKSLFHVYNFVHFVNFSKHVYCKNVRWNLVCSELNHIVSSLLTKSLVTFQ